MATDLIGPVLELVATYGLVAIFVLLVLDGSALLPLVPGELMMVYAVSAYAHDIPSLILLIVLATVAATLGSLLLYGIARTGGRKLVERHPRLFLMNRRRQQKLERVFRHPAGQSLVFFLRFIPLTRVLVNLPAGLARMPALRFTILTFFGMLAYHAGFFYLVYETRRPDSPVAARATALQQAYGEPLAATLQTHWVLTAGGLLALGVLLSLRSSWKTARDPLGEDEGSFLGFLARAVLFWGGVAILAGLYLDPFFVYDTVALSGYDPRLVTLGLPYEPLSTVIALGGACLLLALILSSIRRGARERARRRQAARKARGPLPATVVDVRMPRGPGGGP
jgi:membrane protein DedA with SNARE-associated domain